MQFTNKTVVITGVSSGVGKAAVILFTKQGADVIGIARREDRLEEVLAIVHKHDDKIPGNGSFTPVVGDITKPEDIDRLFEAALEKTGRVDILVNNAGMLDSQTPVGELSDELWNKVMALNLTAPMHTMRKAVDIMTKQESGGCIVNVGSLASVTGGSAGAAYTASKHGLIGLTKNTAVMYRSQKIRCNAICPGGINTEMASGSAGTFNEYGYKQIQAGLGRMGGISQPRDIANVILFLASEQASAINGVALPVDLGFMAF